MSARASASRPVPRFGPGCLSQCSVGLVKPVRVTQRQAETVQWFAVPGVRIEPSERRNRPFEMVYGNPELAPVQTRPAHRGMRPSVLRLSSKRLFPVILGMARGVVVLGEVQTGQVELLVRRDVDR